MSAKKEDKKTTKEKEKEEVVDKKEEKETTTVKKNKKKSNQKKTDTELYCLIDLVDSLKDSTDIYVKLSLNGYYLQYRNEMELKKQGHSITPSITKTEFEQIIKTKI